MEKTNEQPEHPRAPQLSSRHNHLLENPGERAVGETAKLVLYSNAGHAFLFQHLEDFTAEVKAFLRE